MTRGEHIRHVAIYKILMLPVRLFVRVFMHFKTVPVPKIAGPYVVLANHNSDYDVVFVGAAFRRQMYFVAGEHIFRWGFASKLINWAFGPISRAKGSTDASSAMSILRHIRKGYNICMFAEGNCSYNGLTCPIHPTVGKLLKRSGATLVTYRMSGVYLFSPRWAHTLRKGPMTGQCVNVYPPEKLKEMTVEQLNAAVRQDLHEDAFAVQERVMARYRGKRLAEWLETALCICPKCGGIGTLRSEDDRFSCTCGFSVRYGEYGFFEGSDLPFRTVTQWDAWQTGKLAELAASAGETPLFRDTDMTLYSIAADHSETVAAHGDMWMNSEVLAVGERRFALKELPQLSIVRQCNMVFSAENEYFEIRGAHPWNARKYVAVHDDLRCKDASGS